MHDVPHSTEVLPSVAQEGVPSFASTDVSIVRTGPIGVSAATDFLYDMVIVAPDGRGGTNEGSRGINSGYRDLSISRQPLPDQKDVLLTTAPCLIVASPERKERKPSEITGHIAALATREAVSEPTEGMHVSLQAGENEAATTNAAALEGPQAAVSDQVRQPAESADEQAGPESVAPEAGTGGDTPVDPPNQPPAGGAAESDDDSGMRSLVLQLRREVDREYRQKAYLVRRLLEDGATPASPEGEAAIWNTVVVDRNISEVTEGPVSDRIRQYITSPRTPDIFTVQDFSKELVSQLLRDTESFDLADLVTTTRAVTNMYREIANSAATPAMSGRISERLPHVREAILEELVHAVDQYTLVKGNYVNLQALDQRIYGQSEETSTEVSSLQRVSWMLRDRKAVMELITLGGLSSEPGEPEARKYERSRYSEAPVPGELERLDDRAAETLERLHLLKAYPVSSFVVSGERVGLPWDIAVMPPLELSETDPPRYATGAIADFIILDPAHVPDDLQLKYTVDPNRPYAHVTLGGAGVQMRMRLHDNGQLSYGLAYTNVPNDHLEQVFRENHAGPAFKRLLGLFTVLAFDALAPGGVVSGNDVRGSVASTFRERPNQPPGRRIMDLLLRRQRALERAGVSDRQRTPQGWEGPTKGVPGYVRRLVAGTRPRPTAEAEARAYFESINVRFNGLPEGYNFVSCYERRAESDVVYRRARFRRDSSTAEFLRSSDLDT